MKHKTTARFWNRFYALPLPIQEIARRNYEILKENPRHPSLRFKKVGKLWSARVGRDHPERRPRPGHPNRSQTEQTMSTPRFASLSAILLAVLFGSAPTLAGTAPTPPTEPPAAESQSPATPHYGQDIQPIFDRRCIACHGCLGSPCNLKLDSFAGAQRGAFALNPYATHLVDYPRTDMDAVGTLTGWRALGFYPVLTEEPSQEGTSAGNLNGSLMHRLLAAGCAFNQPGFSREALAPVYAGRYAYGCPSTVAALDAQLAQNPAQGMPFGLPALDGQDFDTLTRWIGAGAPGPTAPEQQAAARPAHPEAVARWETFFNDPDPRHRLVSRCIYEHV